MIARIGGRYAALAVGLTAVTAALVIASVHVVMPWAIEALAVAAGAGLAAACALTAVSGVVRRESRATRRESRQMRRELRSMRREASDRAEREVTRARQAEAQLRASADRVIDSVRRATAQDVAEIEALLQLLPLAGLREAIPRTRGYPASPDVLLQLVALVREHRPSVYVDFGAGVSTVVVASTVRLLGCDTRVVGIDHDPEYAQQTLELARRHGVADLVDIRVAPLVALDHDPHRLWYDTTVLRDLDGIGVAFVDGPPGHASAGAREPVRQFLAGRLAPGAVVVLDDADRADERRLAEQWATDPRVVGLRWLAAEKGMAMLEFGAPTS